jgi:hypothetical protein
MAPAMPQHHLSDRSARHGSRIEIVQRVIRGVSANELKILVGE